MTRYIIQRLLGLIPVLLIIITLCFFVMRLAPGNPFSEERAVSEQVLRNLEKKFNMDQPLWRQYLDYLFGVVQGDFGPSFRYQDKDVAYYLGISMPVSIFLGGMAILVSVVLGVSTGVIAALRQNRFTDHFSMSCAMVWISVPAFVTGPLLMYFLAVRWGLLPTSGWITGRFGWWTLIMPLTTLALPRVGLFARFTRASVLDVLKQDYVRTAHAKGLKESTVVVKHVLKGSLIPIVTLLAPMLAFVVSGSFVVESIFRVPGVGAFAVKAALNRDYTMAMGIIIASSSLLVFLNFVADILYSFIDPRISYK